MNFHKSKKLDEIEGIVHGFSDREAGADASVIEKYSNLSRIAQLKQIHSGDVIVLHDLHSHDDFTEGDALITKLRGVGIGIRTADCVPILMTDQANSVVAAIHAGWRGTLSGIVENTVKAIKAEYGIDPSLLTAAIGPSISNCCYEIGEDVALQFKSKSSGYREFLYESGSSKYTLDLGIANEIALKSAGVRDIELIDICTKCNCDFYSYRREGEGVNTQLSFIALSI